MSELRIGIKKERPLPGKLFQYTHNDVIREPDEGTAGQLKNVMVKIRVLVNENSLFVKRIFKVSTAY